MPENFAYTVSDDVKMPGIRDAIEGRAVRTDAYPVSVVDDAARAVDAVCDLLTHRSIGLLTDERVSAIHAGPTIELFRQRGISVVSKHIPPGEKSKSLPVALELLDWLADTSLSRRDAVVLLGGGVVIDTGGWVASAYMRGIPYINMPTTLLAGVDAALGGKVAVDHPRAKNLIGSFYQPLGVVTNVGYMSTLDRRQLRAGLAESIKKGVIASPDLFRFIEDNLEAMLDRSLPVLAELVRASSVVKCALIERDPYEVDLRRPLNFGHTLGHALETVTDYGPVLHGEAVAFGMAVAARIARRRRLLDELTCRRIHHLLRRAGLPTGLADVPAPVEVNDLLSALTKVRLIRDGHLRFVLPLSLGRTAIVDGVSDVEITEAIHTVGHLVPLDVGRPA